MFIAHSENRCIVEHLQRLTLLDFSGTSTTYQQYNNAIEAVSECRIKVTPENCVFMYGVNPRMATIISNFIYALEIEAVVEVEKRVADTKSPLDKLITALYSWFI